MAYGSIYSKSDVRNALLDANNFYKSTYNAIESAAAKQYYDIDKYEQTAMDALNSSYNQALSQYNTSANQTAQSIYGSDLGSNYKAALIEQNRKAMQDAYASYRQNYMSSLSDLSTNVANSRNDVAKTVATARNDVDASLDADVKFAQMYDNAYYDYLSYLWENNPSLFDDERYGQYLGTDEYGQTNVKDKAELVAPGGLLYDVQGNLTDAGKDFIRLLENGTQGKYSFGSYLESNKNYTDLLDWAMSVNDVTGETNRDKVLKNIYGIGPDETVKFDVDNGITFNGDKSFSFTDDNIVKYNSLTMDNKSYYVSPDELKDDKAYKLGESYSVDEYLAKFSKYDDAKDIVNDIKRGIIKNGTVFKRGKKKYMYQNGEISRLNDVTYEEVTKTYAKNELNKHAGQNPFVSWNG